MTEKAMTCGEARNTIQCSLDSLPLPEERLALTVHLESCAACRQEQDVQRRLVRLTDRWANRAIEASDPGENFTRQVLSRLETHSAPSRLRAWLPPTVAVLLLGALILVPGIPHLSVGATVQNVSGLPNWLQANLAALPGDSHTVFQAPAAASLPAWATALLLGMVLLNAGFSVHARQRSVS